MNSFTGQLLALFTAACWAQNSLVYAAAGRRVGSTTVTHIRLWIAFPLIVVVHLIMTGHLLPPAISPGEVIYLALSGLLGYCIADLFIFRAFVDLGPRNTLVVLTCSPIFSTIISWFTLRERLDFFQVLGIVTTILGIVWVVASERKDRKDRESRESSGGKEFAGDSRAGKKTTASDRATAGAAKEAADAAGNLSGTAEVVGTAGAGKHSGIGLLCAFLGTLTQAAAMVLAKSGLGPGVHPVSANMVRISAGLLGLVIFAAARKQLFADFRRMKDGRALLLITIGAVVGPVFGIIMTMYALSLAPVGIVTALMQVSPVMLLPIEKFVFKTPVSWGAAAGTVVAIGGTVILFLF